MNSKEILKAAIKIKHLDENNFKVLSEKGWQIYAIDKNKNFKKKSPDDMYFSTIEKFNSLCYDGCEINCNNQVLLDKQTGKIIFSTNYNARISLEALGDELLLLRRFKSDINASTCVISSIKDSTKIDLLTCQNVFKMCNSIIKVNFENDPTDHFYSCLGEFKQLTFLNQYFPTEIFDINKNIYFVASSKTRCTYVVNKTSGNYEKKYEFYLKPYFYHKDYIALYDVYNKGIKGLILRKNLVLSPLCYSYDTLGNNYFFLLTDINIGLGTILRRSDFSVIATNIDYDAIACSNDKVIFYNENTKAWHLAK